MATSVYLVYPSAECTIPQTPNRIAIVNEMLRATVTAIEASGDRSGNAPNLKVNEQVVYCGHENQVEAESQSFETLLAKVISGFHDSDYVSYVKRRSASLSVAVLPDAPATKLLRAEVSKAPTHIYDSDSDDAEFGFADEQAESVSSRSSSAQWHGGATPKSEVELSHSSCPPFPSMWESATQHVMGTLTALSALLPSSPSEATMEESGGEQIIPCWLSLVGQGCSAKLSSPANIALFPAGGRHHAKRDRADGFCIFNDVVLAALAIQQHHRAVGHALGLAKPNILVVDIDAHHGDGTEEAFAFDASVTTLSIHGFGVGIYPGTGEKENGNIINIPVTPKTTSAEIVKLFSDKLTSLLSKSALTQSYYTHVILVAGTDAIIGDPFGVELKLSIQGFREMVGIVTKLALDQRLPLLILGAGGYVDTTTAICWSHIVSDVVLGTNGQGSPLLTEVPDMLEHFQAYKRHNFLML